ncbi:MAG: hypothetical protein ACUVRZ_02260 [Desulfobacca sp.]|uniref:hypothetical protein n=1 Tax=Desulfobacca sp. TaxID=2067990 RepID=UPI00404A146E
MMWVADQTRESSGQREGNVQEKLDRALVAGLIVEVILDQTDGATSLPARQQEVKRCLQDYLVQYLAGRISLDHFRRLVQNLDSWFDYYFSLLAAHEGAAGGRRPVTYAVSESRAVYRVQEERAAWLGAPPAEAPSVPKRQACWEELLESWLAEAKTEMPQRPHRKLTPDKVRSFLCQSGGRWFRLRDFERFVQLDRKTAWDYLQQFLQAGLICHNRKNSAAVRYCLAPSFLKVEADALRLAVSLCLSSVSEEITEKVSDFLIATAGEPFSLKEWQQEFPDVQQEALLADLVAQEILIWRTLPTGSRFLQLHRRWRQPGPGRRRQTPETGVASRPGMAPDQPGLAGLRPKTGAPW